LTEAEAVMEKIISSKSPGSGEFRITHPNGSLRFIQSAAVVVTDETGQVIGVVGVNIDTTERKESEEALRLSEQRFSSAFEHGAIGMALVSLDGCWLKVNQALCDSIGYSPEELIGKAFQDISHPEELDSDLAKVRQLLDGEISYYKMEKRYFHKDGRVVWVSLGVSLLRDKQIKPLYFISQIEDISEIKLTMARQRDSPKKPKPPNEPKVNSWP
jgi:PAS domain S-box-containing protein